MFRIRFVTWRSVSVCVGLFCLFGVCLGLFRTCVRPECATAFPPTAAGGGFGAGAPETFTRSRGGTLFKGMSRVSLGFVCLGFVWACLGSVLVHLENVLVCLSFVWVRLVYLGFIQGSFSLFRVCLVLLWV